MYLITILYNYIVQLNSFFASDKPVDAAAVAKHPLSIRHEQYIFRNIIYNIMLPIVRAATANNTLYPELKSVV
jgi:hypothetical protein